MKKVVFGIMASAICLVLASLSFGDEIKIGAGAAPVENVLKPVSGPFEKATGTTVNIIANGPKLSLLDLEKGSIDAACAGLTFEDWMEMMKKEGVPVGDSSLQQVTIGKDKIVVITHKDNPVARLTKEQLKGLFTGKITNWKDVGGKDMPVMVVWGKLIPGTNSLFTKRMLDGEAVTKETLDATTAEDVRQNVASNPEAIGIGPVAVVDSSIKSPETPELSRPIILVTKGNPSSAIRKLIDFINGDGQRYVKK